jgi:hypothetical protein
MIVGAKNAGLAGSECENQDKFPVFSRGTGKYGLETGSPMTASTAIYPQISAKNPTIYRLTPGPNPRVSLKSILGGQKCFALQKMAEICGF